MNKNKLLGIGWLLDVVLLIAIIVIPKDNKLYDILYSVFMLAIFLFPLLLMVGQFLCYFRQEKEVTKKEKSYIGIPALGTSCIILLTFMRFITSIEKHYRPELVIITIVFATMELLLGYLSLSLESFDKKKHMWLYIGIYAVLIVFFFCAMIMSWDHSSNF